MPTRSPASNYSHSSLISTSPPPTNINSDGLISIQRLRERERSAMGIVISKCYSSKHYDTPLQLEARIQALEEETSKMGLLREREAHEHGMREEEWRRERRRLKEEAARLRRRLDEDEERIRSLESELIVNRESECKDWQHWLGTECLMEHMKEEQAQREVAVEKWKQLYLTIKAELDDLVLRTRSQGGRFGLVAEEGLVDRLQMEVIAKEETVEALRSCMSSMEKEGQKKEREVDILRQSLRILNDPKRNGMRRKLRKRWLL